MQEYIYNTGEFFSAVAAASEDRIALKYPDGTTASYALLDELSNKIASHFYSLGLVKGDVLAIFNDKSVLGYSCILAALKAGIIYTNLDLTSPFQRIKKIIERCEPKLILFDVACPVQAEVEAMGIPCDNLYDGFREKISECENSPAAEGITVTGNDGAYIMFTSGSTGFPKGAVITHANLLNFITWGQSEYEVSSDDIFTGANPIYFDNSVFDLYISLFSGAQLVPLRAEQTKDPFALVKEVAKAECTIWFSVPSLLVYLMTTKSLAADSLPAMTRFIFGGEGFPKAKLKKLYDMYGVQAALYNVYGPTECTCICSSHKIGDDDFTDMGSLAALGFIAPNFDYVLMNGNEDGTTGELCLKGPNVGAGYYNDRERTAASFIQNPYNNKYNETIYRTGDLVEVDESGYLNFKGRADNQVKHMGYRIELEEIEAMLNTLEYVDESAVIYERINESLGQIVAFVSSTTVSEPAQVLADLKLLVPEYMVPRKLHILDVLPKNQNGKTDKTALREIKQTA